MFEKIDWKAKVIHVAGTEGSVRDVAAALGISKSFAAECIKINKYMDRLEVISCETHTEAFIAARRLERIEKGDVQKDLDEAIFVMNYTTKTEYPNRVLRNIPEKIFNVGFAYGEHIHDLNLDYVYDSLVKQAFFYVFTTFNDYIGLHEYLNKNSRFTALRTPIVWADMGHRNNNRGSYHDDDTQLVIPCIKGTPTLLERTSNFYSGNGEMGYAYLMATLLDRSVMGTASVLLINHAYEVKPPREYFRLEVKKAK
jgi:hypothetical protein